MRVSSRYFFLYLLVLSMIAFFADFALDAQQGESERRDSTARERPQAGMLSERRSRLDLAEESVSHVSRSRGDHGVVWQVVPTVPVLMCW